MSVCDFFKNVFLYNYYSLFLQSNGEIKGIFSFSNEWISVATHVYSYAACFISPPYQTDFYKVQVAACRNARKSKGHL